MLYSYKNCVNFAVNRVVRLKKIHVTKLRVANSVIFTRYLILHPLFEVGVF